MRPLLTHWKKWLPPVLGASLLTVLILGYSGVFTRGKIDPGSVDSPAGLPAPANVGEASRSSVPIFYEAVGTIRSQTRATISAQTTGRVLELHADEGASVNKGDLLARLDTQEVQARLEQARASLDAALAEQEASRAQHERIHGLWKQEAATAQQLETAVASKKRTEAGVEIARQKQSEAEVALSYALISSPTSGVVDRREVEVGDLAWPGRALMVIHDPENLRLEAQVREGLIRQTQVSQKVEVLIASINQTVEGTIDEIVPSANPVSRSFLVKVALPKLNNVYPGMFGTLRIQSGSRSSVLVSQSAVREVGQLRTVQVWTQDRWQRRYVTVGKRFGDRLEILSGLNDGDRIGWDK